MSKKINVAIAGIGNCASALIQGIHYYQDVKEDDELIPGLMHNSVGGYKPSDINLVAAFEVDKRKVGKDLSEAIFAKPNCTKVFYSKIPNLGVKVKMAPVMDGVSEHLSKYPEDKTFVVADEEPVNVAEELQKSGAEILVTFLPVGSDEGIAFYAEEALKANCALVNCIPVFIASNKEWAEKFRQKGLPVIGDDIKSQVGATIVHRVLSHLFSQRGVPLIHSYQLNVGGNTDFLNLIREERGKTKKISKTESVESQLSKRMSYDDLHIGPSDHVAWLKDRKIAFIRLEGRQFGNIPMEIELRLKVQDSANSAGCVIDAVRVAKLALDRGISGPLTSGSAYFMKHPPEQFTDEKAREMVEEFIAGKRER
ncbi:MAG: inositol-3-phosphate synthase [Candidatus Nealsonbacteria bacterium]|nr:inositol-3-phosphate synthase [Candidatus Nealsonbacteria bacterium]